jgi:pseudaminic acid cytidylyltransferase
MPSSAKNLAIIPARGGSKRIPRKNIKNFFGKPIIAYSIQAALESNLFDEVMVSTDDQEVADVASLFGAKVPFLRSKQNSNDFATTADVIFEVLKKYEENSADYDNLCCIYPTAIFVNATKLKISFKKFIDSSADSLIPITKFSYPIQRGLLINENNEIGYMQPENRFERSQDLESVYHDAGQFYWLKTDSFMIQKDMMMKHTLPFILSENEVQDIDTFDDWAAAEMKYKLFKNLEYKLYN